MWADPLGGVRILYGCLNEEVYSRFADAMASSCAGDCQTASLGKPDPVASRRNRPVVRTRFTDCACRIGCWSARALAA